MPLFPVILGAPSAYYSLLGALALIYVPHALKIPYAHNKLAALKKSEKGGKGPSGYDVRDPRAATALAIDSTAEGRFIARANSCHYNALENFPLFAAAVLGALQAGVSAAEVNSAAAAYVGLRALYTVAFLVGTSMPVALSRSVIWVASIAVVVTLFLDAARLAK